MLPIFCLLGELMLCSLGDAALQPHFTLIPTWSTVKAFCKCNGSSSVHLPAPVAAASVSLCVTGMAASTAAEHSAPMCLPCVLPAATVLMGAPLVSQDGAERSLVCPGLPCMGGARRDSRAGPGGPLAEEQSMGLVQGKLGQTQV